MSKKCKFNRISAILRDTRGATFLTVALVTLGVFIFCMAVTEGVCTIVTTKGVKDAMQNASVDAVTYNMYNTYDGMREGSSAAYGQDSGDNWQDVSDTSSVGTYLKDLLGVTGSGSDYVKLDKSNNEQYKIENLNVSVKNPNLSPSDNSQTFTIKATYTLEIPYFFEGKYLHPMEIPQTVYAGYTPKF